MLFVDLLYSSLISITMKKTVFSVSLLAIVTLVSACTGPNNNRQNESTSDTYLDQQILTQALDSMNRTRCDEIVNDSLKDECIASVSAMITTEEAVKKTDKNLCDTISLPRFNENCLSLVNAKIADQNKVQTELDKDQKRMEINQKAFEKGDYKICDQIEDKNQRSTCKLNTVIELSKEKNDSSTCNLLEEKQLIDLCKAELNPL